MRLFFDLMWHFKNEKRNYLVGICLLTTVNILFMFPPFIIGKIIDQIAQSTLTEEALIRSVFSLIFIGITCYMFRVIWRILLFGSSFKLGKNLRNRLYAHLSKQSSHFFQKKRSGDILTLLTNDIDAIQTTAGVGVLTLIDSTVMVLIVFTSMAFVDWKLSLICILPLLLIRPITSYYRKLINEKYTKFQEEFAELNNKLHENVSSVKMVKAFGLQQSQVDTFIEGSNNLLNRKFSLIKVNELFEPTIKLLVGVSYVLSLIAGSYFVVINHMTIGQLSQFIMLIGLLVWPMLASGELLSILERGRVSLNRLNEVLHHQPDIYNKIRTAKVNFVKKIDFNVNSFKYPEIEKNVLKAIKFSVSKGMTLGVVGKTGSGKTSILKLLIREYQNLDGEILINGIPLSDIQLSNWMEMIGYVQQEGFLFSGTIYENISFGDPKASMDKVVRAAKLAQIHDDIMLLPDGYSSILGEKGINLSGGQRQRISIARALLIEPPVLILDDSLSAVDSITEKALVDMLRSSRKDKITIILTHRLSAVEHSENIIVLSDGLIIEEGTHLNLMSLKGWYASMYAKQNLENRLSEELLNSV